MNTHPKLLNGMKGFLLIWIGQLVSILTSSMSSFALTIWMYEQTGSATAMGLMQVFFITPFLIMSPIAGVLVDRYNRKMMMAVSDVASFIATSVILILNATGHLEFWHLYVTAILYGVGNTFQWPAYSAVIATMVSKEQLGRANGLMSLMEAGPNVVAPLLAGALLPILGLTGILTLDVVTFIFALVTLLFVFIPQPAVSVEGQKSQGGFLKEAVFGFQYIFKRPSLLGMQALLMGVNLFFGIGSIVIAPLVLTRTGNDSIAYGTVQTAGAIGAVVGAVIMSAWGGFKKRVNGLLLGMSIPGILGLTLFGLGRGVPVWILAMVMMNIVHPLTNASNQAIWQSKVPHDLQGRVFSARRLIAWLVTPITPIIGGTLADYVLEPAMQSQGGLASIFGGLVGTSAGSGMSLLMIFCGICATLVGLSGYLIPNVRNVETLLPDADQQIAPAEVKEAGIQPAVE